MTEPAGFTKADLELAAGARSYERGLGYLHAVAGLEVTATEITATVYGSSEYRVRLAAGGGGLRHRRADQGGGSNRSGPDRQRGAHLAG